MFPSTYNTPTPPRGRRKHTHSNPPTLKLNATVTRYVISDHHFDHDNIREYADRPFTSVEDMNDYMQTRWESIIDPDDAVLYGGDIAMAPRDRTVEIVESLPGNITYIAGNHDDSMSAEKVPFPVVSSTTIEYGGYTFLYTHNPEDVPDSWSGWVIHGHTHTNDPFIDYNAKRVNVSVEQVRYTPIPIPQLVTALNAMGDGEVAETITDSPIRNHEWYHDNTPW